MLDYLFSGFHHGNDSEYHSQNLVKLLAERGQRQG